MKRLLLSLIFLIFNTVVVNAATCFWVGGTGTWDNATDTARWSSSSGGAGSTCAATGGVPKNAGDIATFDASSGGGTVTNNVDINIAQITMGAFTGTLTFATNNKNVTLTTAMSLTGTGTRTLLMGSGTWTLSAAPASGSTTTIWDASTTTNLTLNANTSTILISGTVTGGRTFVAPSLTFNNITVANNTGGGIVQFSNGYTANVLTLGTGNVQFGNSNTFTLTSLTIAGTSTLPTVMEATAIAGVRATISIATGSITNTWTIIRSIAFAGGATFTFNSSYDIGNNTGATINTPATGGGGRIIGG